MLVLHPGIAISCPSAVCYLLPPPGSSPRLGPRGSLGTMLPGGSVWVWARQRWAVGTECWEDSAFCLLVKPSPGKGAWEPTGAGIKVQPELLCGQQSLPRGSSSMGLCLGKDGHLAGSLNGGPSGAPHPQLCLAPFCLLGTGSGRICETGQEGPEHPLGAPWR